MPRSPLFLGIRRLSADWNSTASGKINLNFISFTRLFSSKIIVSAHEFHVRHRGGVNQTIWSRTHASQESIEISRFRIFLIRSISESIHSDEWELNCISKMPKIPFSDLFKACSLSLSQKFPGTTQSSYIPL